ncbi:hypothetical protein [Aquipuribacter sp. MA13-6]|uniref:hypothetical protein n=1 Tax=unclassified Aquipuribacter TaxID=2635084 RepID=UPI003EEE32EF
MSTTGTTDETGPDGPTGRPLDPAPAGSAAPAGSPAKAGAAVPANEAVPAAPVAVGTPSAVGVALLLCVALVGLGVVVLRELLVGREVAGTVLVPGGPWLAPLLASATSVVQGRTAVVVGLGGLLLGGLLVASALSGRPVQSVRLGSSNPLDVPVDLDGRGVAAIAAEAALADDEVGTSRASAGRRRVVVDVSVDPRDSHDEASLAADLTRRVGGRLADLQPQPKVRVRVHGAVPR